MEILKANTIKFPSFRYTNLNKEFPKLSPHGKSRGFFFQRNWGGRIWEFGYRAKYITVDFRGCWLSDMTYPQTTRADRRAIKQAQKIANVETSGNSPLC